uniref:C2 tensin-type domain-containing protein n=1 Tax=Rhabditophanes sp. KR3021 TaxID=114890 RepID=A0AC35U177_9BILA
MVSHYGELREHCIMKAKLGDIQNDDGMELHVPSVSSKEPDIVYDVNICVKKPNRPLKNKVGLKFIKCASFCMARFLNNKDVYVHYRRKKFR